jgi:hypothetical protein
VFRLKIMYDKDPTRVMATKIDKQLGTIPTDEDLHSEVHIQASFKAYIMCILHMDYVSSLRNNGYGHLFAGAPKEEVIELLVACKVVHSSPHSPPSSRVASF